jgi:thiamine-monophosphate kinase
VSGHFGLGQGHEFDRLRVIFERLGPAARELGDDCAVIPVGGTNLVASIDLSIEGVHFRTDWLDFRSIGARAAAAALSDLAAEGAEPLGLLVSLGLPPSATDKIAADLMQGVAGKAGSGAPVLGGDLSRSDKYLVDVCVLGRAERPVRRSGARVGDGVWVTGRLGGAALALRERQAGRRAADPVLARRYDDPEPRLAAGQWLAANGATAMIDISDGLAADAAHIAAASGVALEIGLEHVPCWEGVTPLAAAASGEEFELLVTLPQRFGSDDAREFRRVNALDLTWIGACVASRGGAGGGGEGGGLVLTDRGQRVAPPPGYDHFAS